MHIYTNVDKNINKWVSLSKSVNFTLTVVRTQSIIFHRRRKKTVSNWKGSRGKRAQSRHGKKFALNTFLLVSQSEEMGKEKPCSLLCSKK